MRLAQCTHATSVTHSITKQKKYISSYF